MSEQSSPAGALRDASRDVYRDARPDDVAVVPATLPALPAALLATLQTGAPDGGVAVWRAARAAFIGVLGWR